MRQTPASVQECVCQASQVTQLMHSRGAPANNSNSCQHVVEEEEEEEEEGGGGEGGEGEGEGEEEIYSNIQQLTASYGMQRLLCSEQ